MSVFISNTIMLWSLLYQVKNSHSPSVFVSICLIDLFSVFDSQPVDVSWRSQKVASQFCSQSVSVCLSGDDWRTFTRSVTERQLSFPAMFVVGLFWIVELALALYFPLDLF